MIEEQFKKERRYPLFDLGSGSISGSFAGLIPPQLSSTRFAAAHLVIIDNDVVLCLRPFSHQTLMRVK